MFKQARIKLTLWYVAILMVVTVSFSFFVYASVDSVTSRALESQKLRIERQYNNNWGMNRMTPPPLPHFNTETLMEIRQKTVNLLIVLNITILFLSAALSYFLAGKTLKPIEETVKKQKRFISDAAHEIKTPLTAMKTELEVTIRDKNFKNEEVKETLKNSIEEVDKLNELTERLLTLSKYQALNGTGKKEKLNLKELLSKIVTKYNKVAKSKGFEIEFLPADASILGSREEIDRLFGNLMDNAVKYNSGKKNVEVEMVTKSGHAAVRVSNESPEIKEKDTSLIFEPFYRAEESRNKHRAGGVGLGLSIVKEIVLGHKGKIEVRNERENVVSFVVTLPLSDNSQ